MISIGQITSNLKAIKDGLWVSEGCSGISYPDEGNTSCFEVEESSFWFKHRNDCIVTAMRQFAPAGTILDIGGGNGFVSHAIKYAGMEPLLLEPGAQGISNAIARNLSPVICSTLQDAGFKSNTVPAAGLFDVLEHIEDDTAFLKILNKILIPEGRVYFTVPAYNLLFSNIDKESGHFRRYTIQTLSRKLRDTGFKVEFASYIFSFLPLPIFLFRTIPNRFKKSRSRIPSQISSEHQPPWRFASPILEKILAAELQRIRNKARIPFGGSCLLIAKKMG